MEYIAISTIVGTSSHISMKRKFNQWWSTISLISTKWTTTSLTSNYWTRHKKDHEIYDIGNPGPGLGKAQIYGCVKLINGIINLPLIIGFLITIQIKTNNEKPAQIKKNTKRKDKIYMYVLLNKLISEYRMYII